MTLIESMMSQCVKRVKTSQSDGMLGHKNSWTDSEVTFMAAVIKHTNRTEGSQLTVAEKPDLSETYTVVVPTGTALSFHDVFRRVSDSAIFRMLGDVRDTEAPAQSSVQISKAPAERWVEE